MPIPPMNMPMPPLQNMNYNIRNGSVISDTS